MRILKIVMALAACAALNACTDFPTMLAGGIKGYCKHNADAPCTRPSLNSDVYKLPPREGPLSR